MTSKFKELYSDELQMQEERYGKLKKEFESFFGYTGDFQYFSAPGRTEVGGNHTDHQRGKVLTASVNLDIIAAAVKRDDNIVTVKSLEYTKYDKIDLSDLTPRQEEREKSSAVIRGICARCKELGFKVGGFDCFTISRVLKGSGLSSSAAFEVLVTTVINHLFNDDKIDPVTVAKISQFAENEYFGKPSGLLDQSASSVGGFTAIDFEDKESPKFEKINFDLHKYGYNLCVVDTGGNHADLTHEYAAIPQEMKKVCEFFKKDVLRQVDEREFYKNIKELRQFAGDRAVLRAVHFFSDNNLAEQEAQALKSGDFETFLSYVRKSGISSATRLQNVFASSAPSEQGLSVALAVTENILGNKGAFRVHGGGFAGTIQAYVPNDLLKDYIDGIEAVFGDGSCYVLSIRNAGGTKVEL